MIRAAVALVVALAVAAGCQTIGGEQKQPEAPAEQNPIVDARQLIVEKKYPDALAVLQMVLREERYEAMAPEARYLIATVYVSAENPQRDYVRALTEFEEFLRLYPTDEHATEVKSWKLAIKTMLDTKKENERLHKTIEGLKQLDVRQEQKRLGK